ncbi:MAG: CHAP domain-containing protein, partial [Staphylococcus lugdunensis]|nr:CHAP domain-containing protein [Staphylococcus lugdunensis]
VFDKRAQDGHTISTFWGDARNWAGQASSAGFKVDHSPKEGSIMQTTNGPYGHVAYVERVNKDGSIFISEMNWIAPYIVSTRTISASEVDSYTFIH